MNPPGPKRYPTLTDLKEAVWRRLVAMKTGTTQPAAVALDRVFKLAKRRATLSRKLSGGLVENAGEIEAELAKARSEALRAFEEALESVDTGRELEDTVLWQNAASIQSLYDRLESLNMSGISEGCPPSFPKNVCVYDYNILPLTHNE